MKPIKILLVLFTLFYFGNGTAWAGFCVYKETNVVFANGVDTTRSQALDTVELIKKLTIEKLQADNINLDFNAANIEIDGSQMGADCDALTFERQYHQTSGLSLDLFEALTQIIIEDTTRIWLLKFGLDIMPDAFRDKILEFQSAFDEAIVADPAETQAHIAKYNSFSPDYDYRVIAVSHSQGNLFSNTIYANLDLVPQYNHKIVSVATPSSFTAGGGPHTTLHTDLVILALKAIASTLGLPEPRESNVAPSGWPELTGHIFNKTYMEPGSNAETKILDDIFNLIPTYNYGPWIPTCQDGSPAVEVNGGWYCNL